MPEQATAARPTAGADGARLLNLPVAHRAADIGSYDADARTVEMVVATETLVRMPGYMLGLDCAHYFEVLDCKPDAVDFRHVAADNCPVLDAHARWSVKDQLGKLRGARCENGQVVGVCHFGQSDGARAVEAEVAGQTPPKVSAGYRREQAMFERFEGDTPVYRITKWTLQEASFVPVAADLDAGVRSDAHTTFPCTVMETRTMPEQNGSAAGAASENNGVQTPPAGNDGNRAADAGTTQPPAAVQPSGDAGTRAAAEQPAGRQLSRFSGSTALAFVEQARAFGDDVAKRAQALVDQNERGEISVETANVQLLAASAEAQRAATSGISAGGQRAEVTADERDKFLLGATNSIIQRAGLTGTFLEAARRRGEDVAAAQRAMDPGEFRGIRNAELARMTLERAGARISSYDRDQIVAMALTHRSSSGMNTTSDFAVLLENVMHKTLQAAYAIAPDTWTRFCGIGSVSDFRAHNRYLRGSFGVLDSRNEAGEFKNKSIPDGAKETIQANVKGHSVALTRDAIVNDDLGAFNFITVELGRAAKLSIEVDVYALLAENSNAGPTMNDGSTLFHANHDNIAAIAAAPSVDSFDALRVLMASQTDVSGNEFADIRPAIWLGPVSLGGTARVINDAVYDPDTANKLQKPNKVRGLFSDVVDTPRLSGTRWYALADPTIAPAIEVVFLNGVQEPYLEQREGWRTDGTEFKVRHDYGVGGVNYRSAATNAGA